MKSQGFQSVQELGSFRYALEGIAAFFKVSTMPEVTFYGNHSGVYVGLSVGSYQK